MSILNKSIKIGSEKAVYWMGRNITKDDFGGTISISFIDGKTNKGPWAIMNEDNHKLHGVGLGVGRGQKYWMQADGRWLKVG